MSKFRISINCPDQHEEVLNSLREMGLITAVVHYTVETADVLVPNKRKFTRWFTSTRFREATDPKKYVSAIAPLKDKKKEVTSEQEAEVEKGIENFRKHKKQVPKMVFNRIS